MEFEMRIQKLRTLTTWMIGAAVFAGFMVAAAQILLK